MKSQEIKIKKKYKGEIFKTGQLVKCINNEKITFSFDDDGDEWNDNGESFLEVGKIYKVHKFDSNFLGRAKLEIADVYIWGEYDWFYPDRFISLTKERRKKLKKLKSI